MFVACLFICSGVFRVALDIPLTFLWRPAGAIGCCFSSRAFSFGDPFRIDCRPARCSVVLFLGQMLHQTCILHYVANEWGKRPPILPVRAELWARHCHSSATGAAPKGRCQRARALITTLTILTGVVIRISRTNAIDNVSLRIVVENSNLTHQHHSRRQYILYDRHGQRQQLQRCQRQQRNLYRQVIRVSSNVNLTHHRKQWRQRHQNRKHHRYRTLATSQSTQ